MKNIYLFFVLLSSYMICAGDGMVISEDEKAIFLSPCSKEQIVEALHKNPERLIFEIAKLKKEDVDEVVEAIKANESLQDLVFDLNGDFDVADEFSAALEALAKHAALKKLTIRFKTMNDGLAVGLKNFSKIEETGFSDLTIHKYQTNDLAHFLQQNPLKKLTLSKCTIHGTGGKALIAALKNHPFLQEIILVQNWVKIEMNELCDALKSIKNLRQVTFEGSRLDDKQLSVLANGVGSKIPFVVIKVSECKSNEGFSSLIASLTSCTSLHELKVSGKSNTKGKFTKLNLKTILAMVNGNESIKSLDLSDNHFSDEQAHQVIEFIKSNKSLTSLSLNCCGIQSAEVSKVLEALKFNSSLLLLNIEGNKHKSPGRGREGIEHAQKITQRLKNYLQRNTILSMPKEEFLKYHQVLEILCCAKDVPTELIEKLCRMVIIFSAGRCLLPVSD